MKTNTLLYGEEAWARSRPLILKILKFKGCSLLREDIKAELKGELIIFLADNGYPPIDRDEIYKEIFEQAENFKNYRGS